MKVCLVYRQFLSYVACSHIKKIDTCGRKEKGGKSIGEILIGIIV